MFHCTCSGAVSEFNTPRGIASDPDLGALYIADQYNHRIMRYVSGAISSTMVASRHGCGSSSTQLYEPVNLQSDSSSNSLFISNIGIHTIVR